MRKELSLNTQLTSVREAISLLKQLVSNASILDLTYEGSRAHSLQQLIYSLRDIQYRLRGLKHKVARSSQERKLSIDEICDFLNSELNLSYTFEDENEEQYIIGLQHAQDLLKNVQRYIHMKPTIEDKQEEADRAVVDKYILALKAHNFPVLTKSQCDILHNRLLQELEIQQNELF